MFAICSGVNPYILELNYISKFFFFVIYWDKIDFILRVEKSNFIEELSTTPIETVANGYSMCMFLYFLAENFWQLIYLLSTTLCSKF